MEKLLFNISEDGWVGRPRTAREFRNVPGQRPNAKPLLYEPRHASVAAGGCMLS
jgi:hypothetical protein